jgi:hypothetical protein
MRPFFSFDFYTFEYKSGTATGNNPVFNDARRYEVENNQDLHEYMKYQFLRIDFIDEAVELDRDQEVSDYIGSVRIPLKQLLENEIIGKKIYPIHNEKNLQTGDCEISLGFFNSNTSKELLERTGRDLSTLKKEHYD